MSAEVYVIPGDRVELRNGDRGTVERMVSMTNVMVRTDADRLIQTGTRHLKVIATALDCGHNPTPDSGIGTDR